MAITFLRQPPTQGEATVHHVQDNVSLHIEPASTAATLLASSSGQLTVAEECVYWFSSTTNTGLAIPYQSIIIHAIARESPAVGPNIYFQLEGSLEGVNHGSAPSAPTNGTTTTNGNQEEEEDGDDEDQVLEIRLVPGNLSSLDDIYENLSYCASMHPDPDADEDDQQGYDDDDEDQDIRNFQRDLTMYEDDEADHEGLYADADIQGGYIPRSERSNQEQDSGLQEEVPAIDLESGEWYTGNPETDAKFELSEQGQVIVKTLTENGAAAATLTNSGADTGSKRRQDEGRFLDDSMDVDQEKEKGQDGAFDPLNEEHQQLARSKMWRKY